jgi:transposase
VTDFLQDHPQGVVLALDQLSLYFQATLTRVWARRGQTPTLRIATQRQHIHFYGALNVLNGHQIALPLPEQSGDMTCHFLRHLQACYPARHLLILWDRAKWHKARLVQHFLAQQPLFQTLHFPPSCPQLNPQEHVWELTRDAISHNHTYHDFPTLVHDFHQYLEQTRFHFDWIERYAPPILVAF